MHWWNRLPAMLACGTILGILLWFTFDKNHSLTSLFFWGAGGAVGIGGILILPCFRKSELKQVNISENDFRIINRSGTNGYLWTDLQAAYFEKYPIVNMGVEILCFEFRVKEKTIQVPMDGMGHEKIPLFFDGYERLAWAKQNS